jgi:hypothetical protein
MLDTGMLSADAPANETCDVGASQPRARGRSCEKDRNSERRRLGTRQARKLIGRRKDRAAFLELLARHGDPAVAAERLGLPLMLLYRHRDADPRFAAEWQSALGYAWEQVETRVLAALLAQLDRAEDSASGSRGGLIDSRLALAILNGRERPVTRQGARSIDSASVARLRAEIRALAGKTG